MVSFSKPPISPIGRHPGRGFVSATSVDQRTFPRVETMSLLVQTVPLLIICALEGGNERLAICARNLLVHRFGHRRAIQRRRALPSRSVCSFLLRHDHAAEPARLGRNCARRLSGRLGRDDGASLMWSEKEHISRTNRDEPKNSHDDQGEKPNEQDAAGTLWFVDRGHFLLTSPERTASSIAGFCAISSYRGREPA